MIFLRIANIKVRKEIVCQALMTQEAIKTLSLGKIEFEILQMI